MSVTVAVAAPSPPTRTTYELAERLELPPEAVRRLLAEWLWSVPGVTEEVAPDVWRLTPDAFAIFGSALGAARLDASSRVAVEPEELAQNLGIQDELGCAVCGRPLPASVRRRRGRCCSARCRYRLRTLRRRAAASQGARRCAVCGDESGRRRFCSACEQRVATATGRAPSPKVEESRSIRPQAPRLSKP